MCFGSNFVSCFLTPQWANSLTYPIATQSVAVSPTAKYVVLLCSVVSSPFEMVRNSARLKATGCSDSQIAKKRRRTERYATRPESKCPFRDLQGSTQSQGSSVVQKVQIHDDANGRCLYVLPSFWSKDTRMDIEIEDTGHHPGPEYESIIHYMRGRKTQKNSTLMF